ncbi:MAG TPA: ribonuclease D, partial [Pseudonocardiaceae bacterium]|nr:ribonuclease D [Pseudonocardiaceae bacterium]
ALPARDLPPVRTPGDSAPPVNRWADRDPEAAARLSAARIVLGELSEQHRIPLQNLLQPDLVRRLCWEPPEPLEPATVDRELAAGGARRWQRDLAVRPLTDALVEPPTPQVGELSP